MKTIKSQKCPLYFKGKLENMSKPLKKYPRKENCDEVIFQ